MARRLRWSDRALDELDASEYVRELIRRERDRQRLRALLLEGPAAGPGVPVDKAWFEKWRARIRASGAA